MFKQQPVSVTSHGANGPIIIKKSCHGACARWRVYFVKMRAGLGLPLASLLAAAAAAKPHGLEFYYKFIS